MTPKEILYVEDALGHAQFLTQQNQAATDQLSDPGLRQLSQQLAGKNQMIFQSFYALV